MAGTASIEALHEAQDHLREDGCSVAYRLWVATAILELEGAEA